MFRKHNTFNLFYFLIFLLNIYALASHNQTTRMIGMPSIGISLILYLLIKTKLQENFHRLILIGLVLSMAGDIQLLFTSGTGFYFLTAMIATLIGYLFYAMAYFQDFKRNVNDNRRIGNVLVVIVLVISFVFYFSARKNLEEYSYPIIAYFATLLLMLVLAAYRYKRVNKTSFKLILTGTIAFVISDLSIGYYNFIQPEITMLLSYLATYLIAQYLVVMGTIERRLVHKDS